MASLRQKSQAPKGSLIKSGPRVPPPTTPGDAARKMDARKSRVEEKMKSRRMSMRYAEPDFSSMPTFAGSNLLGRDMHAFQLEVAPPLPQLDDYNFQQAISKKTKASQFTASPHETRQEVHVQTLDENDEDDAYAGTAMQDEQIRSRPMEVQQEWDFTELKHKDLDIQAYIRKTMTGADEDEQQRLIAALRQQKETTQKDLQTSVTKHYAEFVNISKEISTLENDMLELKELLNEWKTVPQLMGMDDTLAPTIDKDGKVDRHRAHRNSPLNLQQMYKAQLTSLWSTVEGSQKYLPLVPGRHLVYETHDFVELNVATYKAKQNVSLFLLNDLLLIAGRRRPKTTPAASSDRDPDRGRLVAERCWVLTDLVVFDLKDNGDLTNAIKIKRGKETCVYRASKVDGKKSLLTVFRQVSQELAEKKRKESEAEQERRRSVWQGDVNTDPRMTRLTMFMEASRPLSTIGTSLTDAKDLLWIDEFGDDLTMAIATRDWDQGVKLVERGQDLLRTVANNADATGMLQLRLDSLRPRLVSQIALDLSSIEIRKASAARLIALLVRLGQPELARDTFLRARHEYMLKLVRSIKHEGDIAMYISELAIVCFTVVRHTSDWYMNAFKDNTMASGFVTWAKEQIEYFSDVFCRQVYAPSHDKPTVINDCIRVTMSANRKLRDAGLDFTFLLNSLTSRDQSSIPGPIPQSSIAHPMPNDGFEDSSVYLPSLETESSKLQASTSDLSQGTTAPLSITRRVRPETSRTASGASANDSFSPSTSGASTPIPRPPKSQRRSQLPSSASISRAND